MQINLWQQTVIPRNRLFRFNDGTINKKVKGRPFLSTTLLTVIIVGAVVKASFFTFGE